MKRGIALLMAFAMLLGLCACGGAAGEKTPAAWSRTGYFSDENQNILYILKSEDVDQPGWIVGVMFGDLMTGWTIQQEGETLHGDLSAGDESAEPYVVTVSAEGEDGVLLQVEGGESYRLKPMEMPKATIFVSINTEGLGNIAYAEGETAPEIDPEQPFQSAQINLAEPATFSIVAWPQVGNRFVKWTKNGEDFSTEPQITAALKESTDFVAVFEEDPDWQNPVMNVVGEYQSGNARATIECFGADEALITIELESTDGLTRWFMFGRLNDEGDAIDYYDGNIASLFVDENGEVKSEETEYNDGTGTLRFAEDGGFTWHDDRSELGSDLVFALLTP